MRAPLRTPQKEILRFIDAKQAWIAKKQQEMLASGQQPPFTREELEAIRKRAEAAILPRLAYRARQMGVSYGRVTLRFQKGRFGSCSSLGNLNFNCLLALLPPEVMDEVIVHELCHRRHPNHSRDFWHEVAKWCPDYSEREKRLQQLGMPLIRRLP